MSTTALGLFGVDSTGVPNAFNGGMVSYIIDQARERVPHPNPHAWYQALLDVAVDHLGLKGRWELPKSFPPGIREVLVGACNDSLRSMDCNEICDLTDDELAQKIAELKARLRWGWTDTESTVALALEDQADRALRRAYENQH